MVEDHHCPWPLNRPDQVHRFSPDVSQASAAVITGRKRSEGVTE
ncbi:MAG: hypothetical protein ACFFDJ_09710 [Candidatus Odinarchaeota archaeon]